jgi:methylmalonyl-CoA/ethylmalonyl-CoA epimerase
MNITRLHQVAQRAEDLDRATAFYRDVLGLRHLASYDPPGLVFFDLDGARLLLERAAPSSLLYVEVPDIDAAVEALRAKSVEIASEPHMIFADSDGTFGEAGTEEWMAFFKDTEGNLVGLVERRPA